MLSDDSDENEEDNYAGDDNDVDNIDGDDDG